jgi:hypothetical protein
MRAALSTKYGSNKTNMNLIVIIHYYGIIHYGKDAVQWHDFENFISS